MSLIPDGSEAAAANEGGENPTANEGSENPTANEGSENPTANEGSEGDVKFLFADGVGGEGEVPEWFNSAKYKTVSDQAKGYNELEGKFGSFTGAPKDGKYELEGIDIDDSPLLKLTAEWGAENQLSQDGLGSLIEKVNALAAEQVAQDSENAKEQLGENADKRLSALSEWGKNNLSEEEFTQFQGLAQNAGQVEVLEKLIGKTKNSKLVKEESHNTNNTDKPAEFQARQVAKNDKGQRLMDVDPAYRAKLTKDMQEFYKK